MMPKLPESDLEILLNEEPDRSLASLEADIWAALVRLEPLAAGPRKGSV